MSVRRSVVALGLTAVLGGAAITGPASAAELAHKGIAAKPNAVYGRFVLDPSPASGANAGFFAPLVQYIATLDGGTPEPDSGSLSLFGNLAIKNKPLVPSGIVTLHRPGQTDVAYLTNFRYEGDARTADVLGGSTDGPVVGGFSGTIVGDVVSGTLTEGKDHTSLRFHRVAFEKPPQK